MKPGRIHVALSAESLGFIPANLSKFKFRRIGLNIIPFGVIKIDTS